MIKDINTKNMEIVLRCYACDTPLEKYPGIQGTSINIECLPCKKCTSRLLNEVGWLPIEKAPKDGSIIFIYNEKWDMAPKARWNKIEQDGEYCGVWVLLDDFLSISIGLGDGVIGWDEDIVEGNMPTHFMYLPK